VNAQDPVDDVNVSPFRQLWKSVPRPLREGAHKAATTGMLAIGQARGQLERGGEPSTPICIMGLHRAVLGLGRGARLFQSALNELAIPNTSWDVSKLLGDDLTLPAPESDLLNVDCVVAHLNPLEHLYALAAYNGPRPKQGFRVGYWAWETSQVPKAWIKGKAAVDEIWCPSYFTARAIEQTLGASRPIHVIPHPMALSMVGQADKARFGLAPDKITFFSLCDLRSSLDRKNPLGSIEAFRRSGCGERNEAELLIKVHGNFVGSGLSSLMEAAYRTPGVRILDKKLGAEDMRALRSSIDVVLSLHRAEGFGLVLAEAMGAGKPVIATGWSGNMDFMDDTSSALVMSKEIPAIDTTGLYRSGTWAEPDVDHAAALIKQLATDSTERIRLSEAGIAKISHFADPNQWSKKVRHLLKVG
jgi:glycosyltransferase involved in cell wall biosynthesis